MDRDYWVNKWQNDKSFAIENDRLKEKSYIYTPFPKTNMYGFQNGEIREVVSSDVMARYQRMQDKNVLFPTGCHSLCKTSFVENKKLSSVLNDDISNVYYNQMKKLGIGINEAKHIDMRHNEYLALLQQAFIDLYNAGYIEYKDFKVYFDKKNNKIYDAITKPKELPFINNNCFVLNISKVLDRVVDTINGLKCEDDVRKSLINALGPKRIMKLNLSVSNGSNLDISISEPQFMGGISYIFLNPEYIDITDFVDINEYGSVFSYLEGRNADALFAFSGLYARNPLTGREIPIFISTLYQCDIYLGIPDVDDEDRTLAEEEGLEYVSIVENDTLRNSDFLDFLDFEAAKSTIFNAFVDAEIAVEEVEYKNTEILLSSFDNFGPLFPFLEDKDTNEIFPLQGHLPYAFSSKLRPILVDNVDIVGNTMNGTINNMFTEGMCPLLSIIYDDIGSIISLLSNDSIKEIKAWKGIDYIALKMEGLFSSILMPIIFYEIIANISEEDLPPLFNRIDIFPRMIDIQHKEIKRANNNLIDLDNLLDKYSSDTLRVFSLMSDKKDSFVFDLYAVDDLDKDINKLKKCLMEFKNESPRVDYALFNLIKELGDNLDNSRTDLYANNILKFIREYIFEYGLSKKQTMIFIKLIYPVMPFIAEDIYRNVFNNRFSITNENWPN